MKHAILVAFAARLALFWRHREARRARDWKRRLSRRAIPYDTSASDALLLHKRTGTERTTNSKLGPYLCSAVIGLASLIFFSSPSGRRMPARTSSSRSKALIACSARSSPFAEETSGYRLTLSAIFSTSASSSGGSHLATFSALSAANNR